MTSYREKRNEAEAYHEDLNHQIANKTEHMRDYAPEAGPERWEPTELKSNVALVENLHARSAETSLDEPKKSLRFMDDYERDARLLREDRRDINGPRETLARTNPALEARLAQPAENPAETTPLTRAEQRALLESMRELDPRWSESFRVTAAYNLANVLTNEAQSAGHLLQTEAADGGAWDLTAELRQAADRELNQLTAGVALALYNQDDTAFTRTQIEARRMTQEINSSRDVLRERIIPVTSR